MYGIMIQLYTYMYLFFFRFFSHLGCYIMLDLIQSLRVFFFGNNFFFFFNFYMLNLTLMGANSVAFLS